MIKTNGKKAEGNASACDPFEYSCEYNLDANYPRSVRMIPVINLISQFSY